MAEEKKYEVFNGLEDEDDGSEIVEKLHNDNITLTARVQELEDERDEWKSKVEAQAKIIQDINDLTIKLTDSLGSQIGEANRLLRECFLAVEDSMPHDLVNRIQAHLSQYQPYKDISR